MSLNMSFEGALTMLCRRPILCTQRCAYNISVAFHTAFYNGRYTEPRQNVVLVHQCGTIVITIVMLTPYEWVGYTEPKSYSRSHREIYSKIEPHYSVNKVTRGNVSRLLKSHYDFTQFSLANRRVNIWNSLPNAVVDGNFVEVFKSRLDNFWKFQDVKIDYTANLTGTGDRSEFDT